MEDPATLAICDQKARKNLLWELGVCFEWLPHLAIILSCEFLVVKSEPGSFGAELWSPISQHFPYFPRESGKVVSNLNLYTSVVRGNEGLEENIFFWMPWLAHAILCTLGVKTFPNCVFLLCLSQSKKLGREEIYIDGQIVLLKSLHLPHSNPYWPRSPCLAVGLWRVQDQ